MKFGLFTERSSKANNYTISLFAFVIAFCNYAAYAQVTPLEQFVIDNNGTQLQRDIARAVNTVCPSLVASFGGPGFQPVLDAPESSEKDITLRCNELIATAVSGSRDLGISDNELLGALQQVTGEEVAAQNTMTVRAANSQYSNIAARLGALRLATGRAGSTGPATTALNLDIADFPLYSVATDRNGQPLGGGASADEGQSLRRAGFFINGNYNTGDRDATAIEDGFDFDAFSVTAGLDYSYDTGVIGFSIGYDDFSADFDTSPVVSGGEVEADGLSASVFAVKYFDNFHIDGIVTYGELDYDIERILQYDSNNSDPDCQCPSQQRMVLSSSDGDHLTASITAGWESFVNDWVIQPSLGVSYRTYDIDGYTEIDTSPTGGMELRYGEQSIDSIRSIARLQISRAIQKSFGVLRPLFGAEWHHEFDDNQGIIAAKYAQEDELAVTDPDLGFSSSLRNCLSCFSIRNEEPDTDFGVVGAGLSFVFPNFVQLVFYYEGLVGYDDLSSHAVTVNFRRQF